MGPVIEAYKMGVDEHGEAYMKERFEKSAMRLLRNIFKVGLLENPYLDPGKTSEIVGNPEYMTAGYEDCGGAVRRCSPRYAVLYRF